MGFPFTVLALSLEIFEHITLFVCNPYMESWDQNDLWWQTGINCFYAQDTADKKDLIQFSWNPFVWIRINRINRINQFQKRSRKWRNTRSLFAFCPFVFWFDRTRTLERVFSSVDRSDELRISWKQKELPQVEKKVQRGASLSINNKLLFSWFPFLLFIHFWIYHPSMIDSRIDKRT